MRYAYVTTLGRRNELRSKSHVDQNGKKSREKIRQVVCTFNKLSELVAAMSLNAAL